MEKSVAISIRPAGRGEVVRDGFSGAVSVPDLTIQPPAGILRVVDANAGRVT